MMPAVPAFRLLRAARMAACALLLAACARSPAPPAGPVNFIADGRPEKLSAWRLMAASEGQLVLNKEVLPYRLNTPLFSDYAHKLRTVWMPKGVAAAYRPDTAFDFPVGTIISKTFYYPRDGASGAVLASDDNGADSALDLRKVRLVETRLLVRREAGWTALPYVWNEAQTEAELKRTGEQIPMELVSPQGRQKFTYVVPNVNQCASCHVADLKSRKFEPLGLKARHINLDGQLDKFAQAGFLSGAPAAAAAPRNVDWRDKLASVDARARAYLDINCAHCHNNKGTANTTALHLEIGAPANQHLGLCKPPVAAGAGTGGNAFDITPGKPDDSIFVFRLQSTETGVMMPELGRATSHREGVELIRAWIAAMKESCN
ncbi:SO2930 family diheme c-type cytochrome [Pseudoduganella violaceinigra]|uniref:SO2930 family diheme c-type cytochrome n=1 Tax=Pseudoduganella violaceinigra TaxID=246602 RepID=UPI001E3B7D84|nr:SO2930 family diheme c-type cytochrome [Pseudoduganella violaceinigra]